MSKFLIVFFLSVFSISSSAQSVTHEVLETEAVITFIEFRVSGKSSVSVATVDYTTQDGVKMKSAVMLPHIPFITSIYSIGDKVTVHYNNENPEILTTPFSDFIDNYGLYFVIGLGFIISTYRLYKLRNAMKFKN